MDPNKETQEAADPLDLTPQAETPPESPPQAEASPEDTALAALDKGIEEAAEEPVVVEGEEPKSVEEAKAEESDAKPDDKPSEVEAEIKDLNLKEKAANRFRELTERVEELSTALKAAGIEDVKALPELVERARYGEELVGRVLDTGAGPEQFTQALGYLQLINAAGAGDVKAAEVGSSRVDLQACKLEYSIVSPK